MLLCIIIKSLPHYSTFKKFLVYILSNTSLKNITIFMNRLSLNTAILDDYCNVNQAIFVGKYEEFEYNSCWTTLFTLQYKKRKGSIHFFVYHFLILVCRKKCSLKIKHKFLVFFLDIALIHIKIITMVMR